MRHPLFIVFAAVCLLFVTAGGPAGVARADTAGTVACAISAWSTDEDPGGLDIRAGPGTGSPVIARLPPPLKVEEYLFAAEVSITGSKDGWFRIDGAVLENYLSDEEPEIVFEGEGWLSGRSLGLALNHPDLFEAPSTDSAVVATLFGIDPEGSASGPDSFIADRLHACEADWVEVEGTFLGTRLRGWATGTCSNQVTTCP